MSAYWDNLAASDGDETNGYGDTLAMPWDGGSSGQPQPSNDPRYASGFLQNVASIGTGYLARYLDVDMSRRIAGANAQLQLRTTQNGIGGYGSVYRNPVTGAQTAQLNLSGITPLVLVGLAVWFFSRGN